ncbi:MAG TPA: hypothetical protein VHQ45_06325 [Gemmatimonadaceae bacterium]|jgi:uncharacterized membrane protein SirB2|nr:hypothetical protein [Gemmatimonadaceae bacterium]
MIPYATYKLVHLFGILLTFVMLGALTLHAATGAAKSTNPMRRPVTALHGVGAFLILLGGFGMLARLGVMHGSGFPGWLWVKIGVWVLVAILVILPYRKPSLARPMLFVLPVLGALAAYMAIYKPL